MKKKYKIIFITTFIGLTIFLFFLTVKYSIYFDNTTKFEKNILKDGLLENDIIITPDSIPDIYEFKGYTNNGLFILSKSVLKSNFTKKDIINNCNCGDDSTMYEKALSNALMKKQSEKTFCHGCEIDWDFQKKLFFDTDFNHDLVEVGKKEFEELFLKNGSIFIGESRYFKSYNTYIWLFVTPIMILFLYICITFYHALKRTYPEYSYLIRYSFLIIFISPYVSYSINEFNDLTIELFNLTLNILQPIGVYMLVYYFPKKIYPYGLISVSVISIMIVVFSVLCDFLLYEILEIYSARSIHFIDGFIGRSSDTLEMSCFALAYMCRGLRAHYKEKEAKIIAVRKAQLLKESELLYIQSQFNPHMLYNALNSLVALSTKNPESTRRMASELISFYDDHANYQHHKMISLKEEFEILNSYLNIEKIRFGESLHITLPENSDCENLELPAFILQPLIENAIKYGFDSQKKLIEIKVEILCNEEVLEIMIYDKGKPFPEEMQDGYGIDSIQKKLRAFYGDDYKLEFINTPQKHVHIKLKNRSFQKV